MPDPNAEERAASILASMRLGPHPSSRGYAELHAAIMGGILAAEQAAFRAGLRDGTEAMQAMCSKLVNKCRKSAKASEEEADRIRNTVKVEAEAEGCCLTHAEMWQRCANELTGLSLLTDGGAQPKVPTISDFYGLSKDDLDKQ
jgi:hypothetical protein